MSGIKSLIVLALLAIAGLVLVQNQTPIAVIFLGVSSPMLPLGLWVIAAITVGSMSMLLLAFLVSIGGSGHSPSPRSRTFRDHPNDPVPGSRPPRRRFGKNQDEPIEETAEVWDDDEAWDDRDRQVSQFAPDLEPPREPWELLEDEATINPSVIPKSLDDISPEGISEAPAGEFSAQFSEELDDSDDSDDQGEPGESGESGEPLNLPPNSRYELHQQPVEVYRQGSVYSFSYEKKPSESENIPLNLGKNTESPDPNTANTDRRVPIDLPTRAGNTRLDSLDALEEITPIIEPTDRPASSPNPARPARSPRPAPPHSADRSDPQDEPPTRRTPTNRTPKSANTAPPKNWDSDWSQPPKDDSDWV